jgi:hypothetical protein
MLINERAPSLTPNKDRILGLNTMSFNILKQNYERACAILGKAENPQTILDEFGTLAVQLLAASKATEAFLKTISPDYVAPAYGHDYTPNEDGTVTYNPPPPPPPPEPDIVSE